MVVFRWVTSGKSPTHKSDHLSGLEKLNYKYNKDTNNNSTFIKNFYGWTEPDSENWSFGTTQDYWIFLGYMENI